MKSNVLFAALLCFTLATLGSAADSQLEFRTTGGIDYVKYDPAVVSRENLARWMQLSPNVIDSNYYDVPESLELCVDNNPKYLPCDTRGPQARNFAHNAEVNLELIRSRIQSLKTGSYPSELEPILRHIEMIQTTMLQAQQKRFAFVESWDPDELSKPVGSIDAGTACSKELDEIRAAIRDNNREVAYQLASKDWSNCINRNLRMKVGPYPVSAWNKFLRSYGLSESFVPSED